MYNPFHNPEAGIITDKESNGETSGVWDSQSPALSGSQSVGNLVGPLSDEVEFSVWQAQKLHVVGAPRGVSFSELTHINSHSESEMLPRDWCAHDLSFSPWEVSTEGQTACLDVWKPNQRFGTQTRVFISTARGRPWAAHLTLEAEHAQGSVHRCASLFLWSFLS